MTSSAVRVAGAVSRGRVEDRLVEVLAHGKDYRHYRGAITAISKPRPYKADHAPVVGWRAAATPPVPPMS